eukprot:1676722-Heterocapsa_arctica.AAC.1
MGNAKPTMLERVYEAQTWTLKLIVCATLQAFCEEFNGDSEDAQRPSKHIKKTRNNLQTPVCTCVCAPVGRTD